MRTSALRCAEAAGKIRPARAFEGVPDAQFACVVGVLCRAFVWLRTRNAAKQQTPSSKEGTTQVSMAAETWILSHPAQGFQDAKVAGQAPKHSKNKKKKKAGCA